MMAAFGVAHWVSQQVLAQRGDDPEIMHDVTFAALVGTILGAKIYFAILEHRFSALFSRAGFEVQSGFYDFVSSPLAGLAPDWRIGYALARRLDDVLVRTPLLSQLGSNFEIIARKPPRP